MSYLLLSVLCPGIRLRSVFCSAFGTLGAIYCLSVSGAGLGIGPKCLMKGKWDYHFQETKGAYLLNYTQWNLCEEPPNVVPWNVTLFSLLVAASCLEIILCGIQLVNAIIGVFCGDCKKKVGRREVELCRELACSQLPPHSLSFPVGHCQLRIH
ncbi:Transmembrane 4 L6 family member 5 [Heterocephalus glaber]|uniref:Transmembrane 4 L6 family member 5 n=1 Tax=Heterocephalus glaber TaxID=10181 RepID=G5BWA7_HETGA|nr:Transmembrane 4 L6 family member 5 [Heterocephalus glaber]